MRRLLILMVMLSCIAVVYGEEQQTGRSQSNGSLKFDVGPVWTTSKLYTSKSEYQTGVRGTGLLFSLSSMGKRIYGFGFDLYGSSTTVEIPRQSFVYTPDDVTYKLFYFGPSFVLGGSLVKRLRGELSVGLGMGVYNDKSDTNVGLGFNYKLDVELKLSRSIGIGVEGLSQTCYFKKPDGFELPDDEYYGYRQLGVMLGLRVYY